MPADAPLAIRLAQTLGITASSVLVGITASFSVFTIPRLLESPTPVMLRQWKAMFLAGKSVGQPSGILIALSYFYLSYTSYASSASPLLSNIPSISYAVAGLLSIGIIPYTLTFLMSTNQAILKREEESTKAEKEGKIVEAKAGEESASVLLKRWGALNLGRVALVTASALLGVWTTINN